MRAVLVTNNNDVNISSENKNNDDLDNTIGTSFRTTRSYASPGDDPAWQKRLKTFQNTPFDVRMKHVSIS